MTAYVVIDYEPDPDFSWMEQECFAGEDPNDHLQLVMLAYDSESEITGSLSCIDFLKDSDEWTTGRFDSVSEIPARCDYLREIAREMNLPEGP